MMTLTDCLSLLGLAEPSDRSKSDEPDDWDRSLAIESPLLRQLHRYWLSRCRDGDLPARADIEPTMIKGCLGSVFLAVAVPEKNDFRFSLIGTTIVQYLGADNTGRLVSEVYGDPGLRLYGAVRDGARPMRISGVLDWRRKEHMAYEAVLMPLADDGRTVDRLMGGMAFASAVN